MGETLTKKPLNRILVVLTGDKTSYPKIDDGIHFSELSQMLPSSAKELIEQVKEAPEEPEIIQLVTGGPQELRELIPLFIIPGLSTESEIEELASYLLLPTFLAVLPSTPMSIKELAENYATVSLRLI